MSRLATLPRIMLAPNGARRTRTDHPELPLDVGEIVAAAADGFSAGAGALHAHVRDGDGAPVLDPGLYRELIDEMARVVPDMPVQITTQAVGRVDATAQRAMVHDVMPEAFSVALREMWPHDEPDRAAHSFYHWAAEAGIPVQHILYAPEDVARLVHLTETKAIPSPVQVLYLLGSYAPNRAGAAGDLAAFLSAADWFATAPDWAVAAVGPRETACLTAAVQAGGKARIGFETNLVMADGTVARDNAARVSELVAALDQLD